MSETVTINNEQDISENQSMQLFFHHDRIKMKVSQQDSALFSFYMNMCQSETGKSRQKCEIDTLSEISQFVVSKNWSKIRKQITGACENGNGGNNTFYLPTEEEKQKGWVSTEKPKAPRKKSKYQIFTKECMNRPENREMMVGKKPGEAGGASHVMKNICAPEWQRIKGSL